MAKPTAPTDEIFPAYTDLVDNWRAVDAHWIRSRVVHLFDDAAERASVITAPTQGMMSYLKGTDSLEFRKASTWESVRYPNLAVSSDATTVTLRQVSAGSGIVLAADGSTSAAVLIVAQPTGAGGERLDATGITVKVGTKTAKIATDATNLTVDSPVKVTGDIEATAALKGATAAIPGAVNAGTVTLTGALTAPSASISGLASVGSLQAGSAEVLTSAGLALFRHLSSPANSLSYSNTGAAILKGATVSIQGAVTLTDAVTVVGATEFQGVPSLHPASTTAAPVAALVVRTVAPTVGDVYPNGTIWAIV